MNTSNINQGQVLVIKGMLEATKRQLKQRDLIVVTVLP